MLCLWLVTPEYRAEIADLNMQDSGQYANAVRHGGMLGYVLDGSLSTAIANVEANIRLHHIRLGMEAPGFLAESEVKLPIAETRESLHRRNQGPSPFVLHHLFVDAKGFDLES